MIKVIYLNDKMYFNNTKEVAHYFNCEHLKSLSEIEKHLINEAQGMEYPVIIRETEYVTEVIKEPEYDLQDGEEIYYSCEIYTKGGHWEECECDSWEKALEMAIEWRDSKSKAESISALKWVGNEHESSVVGVFDTVKEGNKIYRYDVLEYGYEQVYDSSDDLDEIEEIITEYQEDDAEDGIYKKYAIKDNWKGYLWIA